VLGADDGGEANLTYTWSLVGTPPAAVTFSANGTNAAKNSVATFSKAGVYTFRVTIQDAGGLSTTSTVSVTVNQTVTTIQIAPASATVQRRKSVQFTATGYDQFGTVLATQPTFTWTKVSGVGSISSTGLYKAPNKTGTAVIKAALGSVFATANVTVI
jgi:PKD repeat protein